ncbi:MAG TPA: EamA family transporter [Streptosporangiaceae bacterium]|nr:EamA family transporter [Streptosporangiaceae bacterium]
MVTILALAAAVLYGSADFLGGASSRRARPVDVLVVTTAAGAAVVVASALVVSLTGLGSHGAASGAGAIGLIWGVAGGVAGVVGLLFFYLGFSVAPMGVVAPVSALASTLLPLGVAVAQGERPGPLVVAGALICLVAVVLVSLERRPDEAEGVRSLPYRLRGAGYGLVSGVMFGLFFVFFRNAGTSGVLWPVAVARTVGVVLACCIWLLARRPGGLAALRPARAAGGLRAVLPMALASGSGDAAANVCYVLATRSGLFGIAVIITALYPGMTVLLARYVLGERMRLIQRVGLLLAAVGVVLVTA